MSCCSTSNNAMVSIASDRDIAPMTSMGVSAMADRLVSFTCAADLSRLQEQGLLDDAVVVGGGSNMLFVTSPLHRPLLHPAMNTYQATPVMDAALSPSLRQVMLHVDAGVVLDDIVAITCRLGLWGLENLSLIPGHIGGAAVQNVGAYGAELADVVIAVDAYDKLTGRVVTIPASRLDYGYRHSMFKEEANASRYIVTAVDVCLSASPAPRLGYKALAEAVSDIDALTPQHMRDAVIAMRRSKLPDVGVVGSVGSYFKNPVVEAAVGEAFSASNPEAPAFRLPDGQVKLSAAWLIDHAGCRDMRVGGASLWPRQPLVLVNDGYNATAADVVALEQMVRDRVNEVYGVTLECEVVKI